jgi:hypothetical protein
MAQLPRPSSFEFDTLTGSTYEVVVFEQPDDEGFVGTLRRLPARVPSADGGPISEPMRRDTDVLRVRVFPPELTPGSRPLFALEGLGDTPVTLRRVSTIQQVRPF